MTKPVDLRDHENYDRDTGRTKGIRMVNITVEITADVHIEVPVEEYLEKYKTGEVLGMILGTFPKEKLIKELQENKIENVFEVHIEMIGGDV